MASGLLLDDADIDIDRILAESEARLAAKNNIVTSVAKSELAATKEHDHEQLALAQKDGPQLSSLSLRVPKLEPKKKKGQKDDAGSEFFHMPRTVLTPQLKKDLQLLKMRNVIALGKQHFKRDTHKNPVPDFSQVGTIIEGSTDGSSARITRKERKRTIVEETLGGDGLDKFNAKYSAIQDRKTSGKKAHYKKLVARRRRG